MATNAENRRRAQHRAGGPRKAARRAAAAVLLAGASTLGSVGPAHADHLPESDAEGLEILHDYYPGYWWDHTDLTVAVQAAPNVDPALVDAIHTAIDVWDEALRTEFGGLITLTDVTADHRAKHKADIVVHYVPTAGGVVFAGYAQCGDHTCPNILVRSDLPPSWDRDPYDPQDVEWIALHELGHALGLGHATNLEESTDLMGYGWPALGDPVLSQCDLDALRHVFAWAFEGVDPYEPAREGPFDCGTE